MNGQLPKPTDHLNALLRVELAAVLAYQHALRSVGGRLGDDSGRLRDLADGHRRNVAALQVCIRRLGGVPDLASGAAWSSFTLLQDELSVQQLLDAEECGLADYNAALPALEGDVRELVLKELIPRQRLHVATLSRLLLDVCAA
ncbi:MAG: ferritin-like domain-containing protein [Holophagales bacterium]|nr:ferritin-like domain-containing protein [Holophagales bacterium]MBK9372495.1 ferritin-like domain-containing protein [Holophagales bacterium]